MVIEEHAKLMLMQTGHGCPDVRFRGNLVVNGLLFVLRHGSGLSCASVEGTASIVKPMSLVVLLAEGSEDQPMTQQVDVLTHTHVSLVESCRLCTQRIK